MQFLISSIFVCLLFTNVPATDEHDFTSIITCIGSGNVIGAVVIKDEKNYTLNELIPAIYNKNSKYLENFIKFINELPEIDDQIHGLRVLYDEMEKHGDASSTTVTTTIAYQVIRIYSSIRSENKDLIYLQSKLSETLKAFPWNKSTNIINKSNDKLFTASNSTDKALVNIKNSGECNSDIDRCKWTITTYTNGISFIIENNFYDRTMHARNVGTTTTENIQLRWIFIRDEADKTDAKEEWQFESIQGTDYFKIKNTKWNEYLFVQDGDNHINAGHLFTSKAKICNTDSCQWKIKAVEN